MIKVKGTQVAPAELEALLLDDPGVHDAGVIGVKRYENMFPTAILGEKWTDGWSALVIGQRLR